MKFYNRLAELKQLKEVERLSRQKGAQFTVVLGRRRIGKSSLIREFVKRKKHLYFFVSKKKSALLLREFSEILNQEFALAGYYENWDILIETLFKQAISNKTIIIFDEFQNFKQLKDFDIFGVFQKYWDNFYQNKNLNLIVAGSLIGLMEQIFSNQKEALYGRITQKIRLNDFSFKTVWEILKDHRGKKNGFKDLLNFYSVFGGSPFYYFKIFNADLFNKDILEIIEKLILENNSPLNEEGRDVLIQEFGSEHPTYFSILEAIAKNKRSFNKIAYYSQTTESFLAKALKQLETKFKLIKKERPVFSSNRKAKKYLLANNFFNFWFRYVYAYSSRTNLNNHDFVVSKIKAELDQLVGFAFEIFCKEFLSNNFKDFPLEIIGNYWDKNGEIDLILANKKQKRAIFVECKLNSAILNQTQINNLQAKALKVDALKDYQRSYLFMVADEISAKTKKSLKANQIQFYEQKDFLDYLR